MSLFINKKSNKALRGRRVPGLRNVKLQLIQLLSILLLLIILHTMAMVYFEGLSFFESLWLTLTTATTVGYGDLSPETTGGRLSTMTLMFAGGVSVLAQSAAVYFEFRYDRWWRILHGDWSWKMKNHIVFLNCPKDNAEPYFFRAVSQLRKSSSPMADRPVIIVSDEMDDVLSERLRELKVHHVNKAASSKEGHDNSSLAKADVIIVLSVNAYNSMSDSFNFDIVSRAREENPNALIISEAVEDENRSRLQKVGANHVVRPIRSYPELIVRTIIAPGAEQIIEELFDSCGEECIKYNVDFNCRWADLSRHLMENDIGTLLAYADQNGQVIANTHPNTQVNGKALYVIAREKNRRLDHDMEALIAKI